MSSETDVECRNCRRRCLLEEAASLGMRCFKCGGGLTSMERDWLVEEIASQ